jgi:hypothetical protein
MDQGVEMSVIKPNLFAYATKELSQDAFICWLLGWASLDVKNEDPLLHQCALAFIKALFDKHNKECPPKIEKIHIEKQYKNIDVLCVINDLYAILIEDKVATSDHSGQLARYLGVVEQFLPLAKENILPIYFKTEDQCDYINIEKEGYRSFTRDDFLSVINKYEGKNNIILDFKGYWEDISFKTNQKKIKESDGWYFWIGFFKDLQKHIYGPGWGYVPNQNGGFLGFWWHFKSVSKIETYLQLEHSKYGEEQYNRLCIKIRVSDRNLWSQIRNHWSAVFIEEAKNMRLQFEPPKRIRFGAQMTLCLMDGYIIVDNDGCIDVINTVKKLKEVERLLDLVREKLHPFYSEYKG